MSNRMYTIQEKAKGVSESIRSDEQQQALSLPARERDAPASWSRAEWLCLAG